MPPPLPPKYGPYALITGASAGLGAEFARQLAAHRLNLILVARRADRLRTLAQHLQSTHAIHVITLPLDLTHPDAVAHIARSTRNVDVGLLVNNAGIQLHGSVLRQPFQAHETLINLNVTAMTHLAHLFAQRFLSRDGRPGGGILFVSSISRNGMPYFATYSASKSFISTFAAVLSQELHPHKIDVLTLEPGLVATEMTLGDGQTREAYGHWIMEPADCVSEALCALGRKAVCTPGVVNRVVKALCDVMPRAVVIKALTLVLRNVLPLGTDCLKPAEGEGEGEAMDDGLVAIKGEGEGQAVGEQAGSG